MARGAVAGAIGMLAMDALWYKRYRDGGGEQRFVDWEFSGPSSFDEAGAPARLGRKLVREAGTDLPDSAADVTNNVVHWLTGAGYGAVVQGLIHRSRNPAASGLATGAGAFANSYGVLGALGLYEPIWEYEAETLKKDLGAHLVYGWATAVVYRVLSLGSD